MSKNDDLAILNNIYQNCKMASECIDGITEKCSDENLKDYIQKQRMHYDNSLEKVSRRIRELGGEPEEPPKKDRIAAEMGINMKTAINGSRQNIAKIMYKGTNMGIADMAQTINKAKNAEEKTVSQAKELLSAEERYAGGLKEFM
ncbi:MAG TPA: hypothetical protein DDX91_05665 [Ruminococcaceae bacterium]|nr:hypothetical protein [Oscillospiraceae bacterium]